MSVVCGGCVSNLGHFARRLGGMLREIMAAYKCDVGKERNETGCGVLSSMNVCISTSRS